MEPDTDTPKDFTTLLKTSDPIDPGPPPWSSRKKILVSVLVVLGLLVAALAIAIGRGTGML